MGPEGWRTFDPDERLIMAMHSSASPLTGALNELSQRVLKAHESEKESIIPLVEARLRVSQANRELDHRQQSEKTGLARAKEVCELINTLTDTLKNQTDQALSLAALAKGKPATDKTKCEEFPS